MGALDKLWLPSLSVPAALPTFTLANFQTATSVSLPSTYTFSNGYSTAAGDCIVISYCAAGSTAPTFSGAGATWTRFNAQSAPVAGLVVGYNCSAGQTGISLTGMSGAQGDICIAIFKGVLASSNPVSASQTGNAASGTSATSPSLAYAPGQLLVAGIGWSAGGASWTNNSWSNGATNHHVAATSGSGNRPTSMDYATPGSGSSTTATETWTTNATWGLAVIALTHA